MLSSDEFFQHFPHLQGGVVSLLLFCVIKWFFQGKVTVSLANHPPASSSPPSPRPLFGDFLSEFGSGESSQRVLAGCKPFKSPHDLHTDVFAEHFLKNCDFLITFFARISNLFVFISNGRTIPHRWHGKNSCKKQPHYSQLVYKDVSFWCDPWNASTLPQGKPAPFVTDHRNFQGGLHWNAEPKDRRSRKAGNFCWAFFSLPGSVRQLESGVISEKKPGTLHLLI